MSASFFDVKQAQGGRAACLMSSFVMRTLPGLSAQFFMRFSVFACEPQQSRSPRRRVGISCTSGYSCCSSRAVRMSDGGDKCHINSGHLCYFKLVVINKGFARFTEEKVIKLFVSAHIRPMKDGSLDPRAHQGEPPG